MTLRQRILLTLVPLVALLALLGGTAVALLYQVGNRADAILRENYDSVIFMERLNEALERIDSSFQFALAGEEDKARQQYREMWAQYLYNLGREQSNITLPGEAEQVERLTALSEQYRRQGDAFYSRPAGDRQRREDYFGPGGLLHTWNEIKGVSGIILRMNQENMKEASHEAAQTARRSLIGFGVGLAVAVLLGAVLAWRTIEAILRPIRSVTQSALAIGRGNLDQVVPVTSGDELGQLAEAFNTMARQLRQYRQSDYARLMRAQQTSQATIDAFPDPVLVVDSEGRVEMANPAAQRILGVSGRRSETAVPWQPPEPLRGPLSEAVRDQRRHLPEGFDQAVPVRVDGQDRLFLPHVLPIADAQGATLGAAVLLADVTRFRLLDQVKSDLVATASHELKTPLTSIRLAVYLLLEEAVGPLSPKQTELLLDARDNAERLLAMVNNLLDLARLEQGRQPLDLRAAPPAELLQAAADAVRPRAEDKGLTVVLEAPADLPAVTADAGRLGHALGNLLDNAVTYTDRGGKITLSAAARDGAVELAVADTGRGIDPQHLPHVFDRFFRVPGQSQEGGTGLGLAIVREIVAAHGGTIACESAPGAGTVFRIRLPAWKQ